jgi:competence protein ComEC
MRRTLQTLPGSLIALLLAERERWFFWSPVLLSLGIGFYFSLAAEPWPFLGVLILLALTLVGWVLRGHEITRYLFISLGLIVAGFTAAQLRTALVAAPMLDKKLGPVEVIGTVSAREVREDGGRIVLIDLQIEDLRPAQTPNSIRLTLRESLTLPPVGASIKVLANLLPPMEPAYPGAYDFRREAFYKGIGAYGMVLRAPEYQGESKEVSWAERMREHLVATVTKKLPGAEGAIAAALMTGERGAIDELTNANMRAAGTTHLLSISGMHIGMVGGFVLFLVRALLALVPRLALSWPLKRIAAVAALVAVVVYTWFVGAPIPAQRATLMAALVFIAILLDRQAITLRSVALAALAILLIFPEALLNPGFQMSFAAILMLVAAYEAWTQRGSAQDKPTLPRRAVLYIAGIVVTSLIAGLATMPYGAWHFHRLQLLGVLGNLIAVPLTGFVVMPAMVLSFPLLPLGLADWPLAFMGWGLQGVTHSAAWIATMPYANLVVGQFGLASLLLITFGGLWLALWQTKLRWGGLAIIALGVVLASAVQQPVMLVHSEGRVAVRGSDGALYIERSPAKGMVLEQWTLAFANNAAIKNWRENSSNMRCDKLGCVYDGRIALPELPVAALEDCVQASLIIAPEMRLPECKTALVIDRGYLRKHGSSVVYADGSIKSVREVEKRRAWEPKLR